MPVLLKTVMENHLDTAMVSIVTDDLIPSICSSAAIWTMRSARRSAWGWIS